MAVPTYKTPQVQNDDARLPYSDPGNVSASAFGALTGRAMENMGDTISSLGEEAGQKVIQANLENLQRVAKNYDTTYANSLDAIARGDGTPDNPGLMNLKGQDAIDAFPKAMKAIDDQRSTLLSQVSNLKLKDSIGAAFDERARAQTALFAQHVAQQREVANDETSKLRIQRAESDAANAGSDPTIMNRSIDIVTSEATQSAQRKGLGPEATTQMVSEAQSEVYTKAITTAAEFNTKTGEQMFAKYNGQMEGVARGKVASYLDAKKRQDLEDMERIEHLHDRQLTESQKAAYSKATFAVSQGTITLPQMNTLLNSNQISPEQYHNLRTFLTSPEKEVSNPQKVVSLQVAAYRGDVTMDDITKADDVSTKDKRELLSILNTSEERGGILGREDIKQAVKDIDSSVSGIKGPMAVVTGDDATRTVSAQKEFRDTVLSLLPNQLTPDNIDKLKQSSINRWKGDKIIPAPFVSLPNALYFQGSRTASKPQMRLQILDAGQHTQKALANGEISQEQADYNFHLLNQYKQINDSIPDPTPSK